MTWRVNAALAIGVPRAFLGAVLLRTAQRMPCVVCGRGWAVFSHRAHSLAPYEDRCRRHRAVKPNDRSRG